MRSIVAFETRFALPFTTFDTVVVLTFAARAISSIVTINIPSLIISQIAPILA